MNYLSKTFISVIFIAILFFVADEMSNYYINYKEAQTRSYENDKLIFDNLISSQEQNLKIFSETIKV